MLPAPCYWIDSDDAAYLRWNYGTVGIVRRAGDRYAVTIQWAEHTHYGQAGSLQQGKRFVERWVSARKALPGKSRRR